MKRLLLVLALLFGAPAIAQAQGCGPSNPNCIVPTAPTGTSNNQAASTAFVGNEISFVVLPLFSSPPPIGNVTPNTGAFTSALSSSLKVTGLASAGTSCVQAAPDGTLSLLGAPCGSGSGAVNSVTNADGSLTISPTAGAVVASLNVGHANTWTALQTFTGGIAGGAAASSTLTLESTSGVGTTDFVAIKTASQIERLRVDNFGNATSSNSGSAAPPFSNDYQFNTVADNLQINVGVVGIFSFNQSNYPTHLDFYNTGGASVTATTLTPTNALVAEMDFWAPDGAAFQEMASIIVAADGTPALNSMPTKFQFFTTPSAGVIPVERLRIDSAGQHTIGGVANQTGAFLEIDNVGATSAIVDAVTWRGNNNQSSAFRGYKSHNNIVGTQTALTINELVSTFSGFGSDGTAFQPVARISMLADAAFATNSAPGRIGFFTTASGAIVSTERMRMDSVGNIWGMNFNGYSDLRLWSTLSCNAGAPVSTNVAQAAVNAYNAGFRRFFLPAGCFIYTGDSPWVSAFGTNNIPSVTEWLGEDAQTSGFSVCSTYTGCTPSAGTIFNAGGASFIKMQRMFSMDGACYNTDAGGFGHPSRCPFGLSWTGGGSFGSGEPYPSSASISLNVGAEPNGTWNGTDTPAFSVNEETSGDSFFAQNVSGNSAAHYLNFFNSCGSANPSGQPNANAGVWNVDGKAIFGNGCASHGTGMILIVDNFGACQIFTNTSGTPGFSCTSDERLKTDIADTGDALAYINSLHIRDFTMRADGSRQTGVVAQELRDGDAQHAPHPEMVIEGPDGYLQAFAPNEWKMIRAIQQLDVQVRELRNEVATLRH